MYIITLEDYELAVLQTAIDELHEHVSVCNMKNSILLDEKRKLLLILDGLAEKLSKI